MRLPAFALVLAACSAPEASAPVAPEPTSAPVLAAEPLTAPNPHTRRGKAEIVIRGTVADYAAASPEVRTLACASLAEKAVELGRVRSADVVRVARLLRADLDEMTQETALHGLAVAEVAAASMTLATSR